MLVFFSVGLVREIIGRQEVSDEITRLENEIKKTETQNAELRQFLDSWNDSSQLEEEARLKLGLQKPGEKVVIINRGQSSTIVTDSDQRQEVSTSATRESNVTKWWNYYFK